MRPHFAAVIGDPVRRSLSPAIFRAFSLRLDRPLHYRAVTLEPGRLAEALGRAPSLPWLGWNVTIPFKVRILPLLDRVEGEALAAGAVNVVRFEHGRRIGYNTDAEGFLAPLRRMGVALRGKKALVLGAGGAARAVLAALRVEEAELRVLNRSRASAEELGRAFGAAAGTLDEAGRLAAEADLVVNATPLGQGGEGSPLPPGTRFKKGALAYDLVYRPARTPFLAAAEQAGARTLGGLAMLVAQATATWRIWFGAAPPPAMQGEVLRELEGTLA